MELQEIEIIIDKNGQVQVHVNGVKGTTCLELTADLEKALGEVLLREMTPESLETSPNTLNNTLDLKS